MKTRVLIKTGLTDAFGTYDTDLDRIVDDTGNPIKYEGLYIIKDNGLVCTTNSQEIKDHLQTFKIISN